jgi:hypothetical protein
VADEYAYYEYDLPTNLSTDVYNKYLVRWKTSAASNGLQAKIYFGYTVGPSPIHVLGFSTDWAVWTGSLTAGKTLDKIRIYADDNPDTINSGTYYVYYDFIMFFPDWFVFPNTDSIRVKPSPKYGLTDMPSGIVDKTQNLGSESATVDILCNLDVGRINPSSVAYTGDDWKRPQAVDSEYQTDTVKGQVFYDIAHNSLTQPFQWIDLEEPPLQMKVTLEEPEFIYEKNQSLRLTFREYSRRSKSSEYVYERFGFNL